MFTAHFRYLREFPTKKKQYLLLLFNELVAITLTPYIPYRPLPTLQKKINFTECRYDSCLKLFILRPHEIALGNVSKTCSRLAISR